jgi:hypothetical protein
VAVERKVDTAEPVFEILFVLRYNARQMTAQRFIDVQRKHRNAVLPTFSIWHGDLCQRKIDVLYPEPNAFHQAQAATNGRPLADSSLLVLHTQ